MFSLALAMLLSALGTSIANIALPTLASVFAASFQQVQWIVLAYLLPLTALIVSIGRLGDLLGRRRLLLAGVSLFSLAALACATPSLPLLLLARACQGMGAATMMALSMAVVADIVPAEKTGTAMGLLGTTSAVGTALGPSLGGGLIALFGWQAVFVIQFPLGLAALLLMASSLPADPPAASRPTRGFDLPGTLLLALALLAYALGMTQRHGAAGGASLPLLAMAGVLGLAFVQHQRRAAAPLLSLSLLRQSAMRSGLIMSLLVSTVIMATLVVGPFYLSRSLGLAAAQLGLVMSCGPLAAALCGVPAGKLVDRYGPQDMTVGGLAAMLAGCGALAWLPASLGVPGYLLALITVTSGYALFQAANNTMVMRGQAPGQRGLIAGLLNLSRNLGLITGTALMGALFAAASGSHPITAATAVATATGLHTTFTVAASLIAVAIVLAWQQRRPPLVQPA